MAHNIRFSEISANHIPEGALVMEDSRLWQHSMSAPRWWPIPTIMDTHPVTCSVPGTHLWFPNPHRVPTARRCQHQPAASVVQGRSTLPSHRTCHPGGWYPVGPYISSGVIVKNQGMGLGPSPYPGTLETWQPPCTSGRWVRNRGLLVFKEMISG